MKKYAIVVDLETTGLNSDHDKIIEIGAIKFELDSGLVIDKFQSFSNPFDQTHFDAYSAKILDPIVVEITGINDDMLVGAPTNREVVESFFQFAQDLDIWAYNSSFDSKFLNCHTQTPKKLHDVLVLARSSFPGLVNYRLATVAQHLNLSVEGAHRAIADCIMAKEVLVQGLKRLDTK